MTITVADAIKDPKKLAALKAFLAKEFSSENLDFLLDKGSNEAIYSKWIAIKGGSPVINLPDKIAKPLHAMASIKNWKAMTPGLTMARANIIKLMQADTMGRFETAQKAAAAEAAKKAAAVAAALKAAKEPSKDAKETITKIEANITTGAAYFTSAIAAVKANGKPADRVQVNRMFESGRLRHDNVYEAFNALITKDKTVTRANSADFFQKKEAFSKQWGEYRKLLGR